MHAAVYIIRRKPETRLINECQLTEVLAVYLKQDRFSRLSCPNDSQVISGKNGDTQTNR